MTRTTRRWATGASLGVLALAASWIPAAGSAGAADWHTERNYATGRCLDANAAGQVYTSPCGPADNPFQHWAYDGRHLVQQATGRCLDSNFSSAVYTSPCGPADNPYQSWYPSTGANAGPVDLATRRILDSNAAGQVYTSVPSTGFNPYQNWSWI